MENINVLTIENFLCRHLDEEMMIIANDNLIVVNDIAFQLLDFEELEEDSMRIKVKNEHNKIENIYLKNIISVEDNFYKLNIMLKNNKTLIIEEY